MKSVQMKRTNLFSAKSSQLEKQLNFVYTRNRNKLFVREYQDTSIMPYVKTTSYCAIPFSEETEKGDFYIYWNVPELATKSESCKEDTFYCRTVGVLSSSHGRFYLSDVITPQQIEHPLIQVSVVYLKATPQSTVLPYPVQVFGILKWKKRPVLIAKIMQVLTISMALRLRDTLNMVTSTHLALSDMQQGTNNEDSNKIVPYDDPT